MTSLRLIVRCAALIIALSVNGVAQSSSHPAPMPAHIYAQKLLNDTLAKHPEVVIMAFHVTPPGKSENVIIASNIGRLGKVADEDDMRVINTGKSNLEVNKSGNHFEVEAAMLDQAGNIIGAVGIVFNYKEGDDKQQLARAGEAIRDDIKAQTPNKAALFKPVG